jgi:putative ABC transport system permease protein
VNPFTYLAKMGRRQIKGNWAQFLAIIAIGGIAVTLFVGLQANADSFEKRVNQVYEKGNLADTWVTTDSHDDYDLTSLKKIVGEDGTIDTRFETTGRIGRNLAYPTVVPNIPTISKPYEVQANDPNQKDFVYIDVALAEGADKDKFQIGCVFDMSYDLSAIYDNLSAEEIAQAKALLTPYLLNSSDTFLEQTGLSLSYTISGVMRFPENIQKAAYSPSLVLISSQAFYNSLTKTLATHFTSAGVSTMVELLREKLGWDNTVNPSTFPQPNQYLISFKNHATGDAITKIKDYFASKTKNNLVSVNDRTNMPFVTVVHNDAVQARQFTFLFPFVFFFVGVLVILTTTSQIILKERTQIGTMKAIGLSKGQIYGHYLLLTDSVVALGILLGEIIGPFMIPSIMDKKYSIIYTLPARTYVFPTIYGLATAVGFLAIASLVTYLICRNEVRLNPAESMRPAAPKIHGKSDFLSLKRPSSHLLSVKMAFRNIRFAPGKSIMVIVGVMGCTALLVCGFGIEDTIYYGIDHDMSLYNNASMMMAFSSYKSKDDIIADLKTVEGVDYDRCDPVSRQTATVSADGKTMDSYFYLLSFDPAMKNSHFVLPAFDHSMVAISKKVADGTGAKVGDTISFAYQGVNYEAPIGTIYTAFAFNGVVAVSDAPFLKGPITYAGCWVESDGSRTPSAIKEDILSKTGEGATFGYVTECNTKDDWYAQIKDVMSGVLIMTNAVKGFGIALALVVLYNLALLNFRERTRDIATMKVLGFSKREIAASLLWETMTLTFLGVGFGFALGYPFLLGVMGLNVVELVSYIYVINLSSYGYSFLLTFVIDFLVNGGLSLLTNKVKMVESLKSVE